jgi:hypothetical protein
MAIEIKDLSAGLKFLNKDEVSTVVGGTSQTLSPAQVAYYQSLVTYYSSQQRPYGDTMRQP